MFSFGKFIDHKKSFLAHNNTRKILRIADASANISSQTTPINRLSFEGIDAYSVKFVSQIWRNAVRLKSVINFDIINQSTS